MARITYGERSKRLKNQGSSIIFGVKPPKSYKKPSEDTKKETEHGEQRKEDISVLKSDGEHKED